MKMPQNGLPVLAYYQPFGPTEHDCAVVACWNAVKGKWAVAETQDWLNWPVVSWKPLPARETVADVAAAGNEPSFEQLLEGVEQLTKDAYYTRCNMDGYGTPTFLKAATREKLITELEALEYETKQLVRCFILCR